MGFRSTGGMLCRRSYLWALNVKPIIMAARTSERMDASEVYRLIHDFFLFSFQNIELGHLNFYFGNFLIKL